MSGLTAFLVLTCFCREECSGYWHGATFFQSDFRFSQIHSPSSCSGERSWGKPNLLRIISNSCMEPISWPRCHVCNWSPMLLQQSESFIKLSAHADSEQNDSSLVSNKHLCSIFWFRFTELFCNYKLASGLHERLLTGPPWKQHHIKMPSFSGSNGEISSTFQFLNFSLVPLLNSELSDSQRKHALTRCLDMIISTELVCFAGLKAETW